MTVADATARMPRMPEVGSNVYVYGVCRRRDALPSDAEGIGGAAVDQVAHRNLAAIVSTTDQQRIRTTRRDLMRHSNVLGAVFREGQVLPFRFGTLYPDRGAVVERLLAPRYRELEQLLAELERKVELGVKAFYDERAILSEVVAASPQIARLREATRSQPAAATHALRLDLGRAVADAVEERRARDADAILRRLRPLADAIVVDDQQVENLVLKASLLVDRERVAQVDQTMDDLALEQRGRMQLRYVGPLPPHSFVAIESTEQA